MWNAGCVRGVVVTGNNETVVATDTGGLWIVDEVGQGASIFDVSTPNFCAIALGPDPDGNHLHMIAGGIGLFENDPSQVDYLNSWRRVPNISVTTTVYNIVVDDQSRMIFLATSAGLLFATIPDSGDPTRTYNWRQAMYQDGSIPSGPFFGLALAPPQPEGQPLPTVAASIWDATAGPTATPLLYWTTWSDGNLILQDCNLSDGSTPFTPPTVQNPRDPAQPGYPGPLKQAGFGTISLASFSGKRSTMYAAIADDQGWVMGVFLSTDGGHNWSLRTAGTDKDRITNAFTDASQAPWTGSWAYTPQPLSFAEFAHGQGNAAWRPNNVLAVSEVWESVVALGWAYGFFVSDDHGHSWLFRGGEIIPMRRRKAFSASDAVPDLHNTPNHADYHALIFRPIDVPSTAAPPGFPNEGGNSRDRLYIGSDGGLISTDDYGDTYTSTYNKGLLNIQCMSPSGPRPDVSSGTSRYGTIGVSAAVPSLFAVGTQDNGTLFGDIQGNIFPGPLHRVWNTGGDGQLALFLPGTGTNPVPPLLFWDNGQPNQMLRTEWIGQGLANFGPHSPLPTEDSPLVRTVSFTPPPAPAILPTILRFPVTEFVRYLQSPDTSTGAPVLYAVGCGLITTEISYKSEFPNWPKNPYIDEIFGLYGTLPDFSDLSWKRIGVVLLNGGEAPSAIACWNGQRIYLGTSRGRILSLSVGEIASEQMLTLAAFLVELAGQVAGKTPGQALSYSTLLANQAALTAFFGGTSPLQFVQESITINGPRGNASLGSTNNWSLSQVARIVFDRYGNGYAAYNFFPFVQPVYLPDGTFYFASGTRSG
jgi:hypothetical protein